MKKYLYLIVLISLLVFGCQKYTPKPIDRQKMVNDADLARETLLLPDQPLTLSTLLELVSLNNPDLQLIRAQYIQQEKFAKTKTPFANPNIGLGLSKGFNIEGATKSLTQPFVSLGFTVPLWGKRKLARDLEFLEAAATQQEYIILHRNIFLELRQVYTNLKLNKYQLVILNDLISFLDIELKLAEKQVLLGQISLLDLGILKAEYEQSLSEKQIVEQELIMLYSKLSGISGLSSKVLQKLEIPKFEVSSLELPSREVALNYLIENSPALNRLHAKYDIAEKSLALEIKKQYPDLQIESGFEKEPGQSAKYLGLALGMELPIFDRNQKGILLAHQKREQILLEYQLQARQAILEMETSLEMIKSADLQIKAIQKNQLSTYSNNYTLAKQEYQLNKINAFDLIAVRKAFFDVNKEYIRLLESYYQHCVTLETTVGFVLLDKDKFPITEPDKIIIAEKAISSKENNNVKK